jgi:hypothetical protein
MTAPVPYRTDLVTALLGAWFTVGLFLDAWAHTNLTELESFFTPWHAVFYTGFFATAAWIAWTVRDALVTRRFGAMPPGYAAATVAVAGFAAAAAGDLAWHTVFGIEQDINILFSPTHLGLAVAMVVILTTPLRSAWSRDASTAGLRRLLPAVLAVALAAAIALLFGQYLNALTLDDLTIVAGLSTVDEGVTGMVVGYIAFTTIVLTVPLLTLARRWVPPFGAATILFAALAGLSGAITEFQHVRLTVALLAAGLVADLLALLLRPTAASPIRFRAYGALVPLCTWSIYLAVAHLGAPPLLRAPGQLGGRPEAIVELYTGVPVVQALIGLLLAVLFAPSVPSAEVTAPDAEVLEVAEGPADRVGRAFASGLPTRTGSSTRAGTAR